MSTADCVKLIEAEDLTPFSKLIKGKQTGWKRVKKFNYKGGVRRYFYLPDSCLLATVDEVNGQSTVVVRPPMLWELYMLQEARHSDSFLQEEAAELHDEHYDFCRNHSAKYSEPQQYTFCMGSEDGGWLFFSPKLYDHYDQHLTSDLYDILPASIRNNEECECTFSLYGVTDDQNIVKQDLISRGFEYHK